jgi:hypothetical protein
MGEVISHAVPIKLRIGQKKTLPVTKPLPVINSFGFHFVFSENFVFSEIKN